jgi:hypothetical protein
MITKGSRLGGQPSKLKDEEARRLQRISLEEKVFNKE